MSIPATVLQRLYTYGSLQNVGAGIQFSLKNRLADAAITGIGAVAVAETAITRDQITLHLDDGSSVPAASVSPETAVPFTVGAVLEVAIEHDALPAGKVALDIEVHTDPFGTLSFSVVDSLSQPHQLVRIPRNRSDDYTDEIVGERRRFVHSYTGVELDHLAQYSFDPHTTKGNIENFI